MKNREYSYLTNCNISSERIADYNTRDSLREKFIVPDNFSTDQMNGFCGNIAAYITFSVKTKKAKINKEWACSDDNNVAMCEAIPSALALYRLCAFDAVQVIANGLDGYKCVWSVPMVHASTGTLIVFGEHKGAFSFWLESVSTSELSKEFKEDLLKLLTYLVSDTCAHPYDGLIAGSVA